MGFFNDLLREALFSGRYICNKCGARMEFEDEWEDTLVCPSCGHSVDLDHYGAEDDESYEALYPTEEEIVGYKEKKEDEYTGETYDEVCGELDED